MPTLADIAKVLNVPLTGGGEDTPITGVAMLPQAGETELSYLGSDRFLSQLRETRAAAVLITKRVQLPADCQKVVLLVDDADLAVARVLELFAPPIPRPGRRG